MNIEFYRLGHEINSIFSIRYANSIPLGIGSLLTNIVKIEARGQTIGTPYLIQRGKLLEIKSLASRSWITCSRETNWFTINVQVIQLEVWFDEKTLSERQAYV
ncbi:hypothetical protein RCL_jg18523.t1 [Rhizophagus clarus]|uniref:Uncharacterized protein n=1 Tax=Rhizophagus clarus TaxID=94130 RepID=A0A8H3LJD3_9GLOM|nr:hypothetical protein RCL_jg18523.t1 [Rhizophagus clarus]